MKKWIKNNPLLSKVVFVAIAVFAFFMYMHFIGDPANW